MMYYFKSSYSGFAADGTPLPANLQTNPMMAVMNSMNYDAMTLGNHEFNYGSAVFNGIFKQAQFPLLGANVSDYRRIWLGQVGPGGQGVQPYIEKTLGGIKVAILGITNHRVPNYELPSNIVGLTFTNPITTGQQYAPQLKANNDVVIALTHIGFTDQPQERRSRQQRRYQLGRPGTGHRRHHRRPQPHQPGQPRSPLQVPADDRRQAEQHAGDHQPGLSLQQHPGRGRHRRAGQGRAAATKW